MPKHNSGPISSGEQDVTQTSDSSRLAGGIGAQSNLDQYRSLIEPNELTAEEADQLLLTLWSIMRTFVELGWGVESVQRVLPFMATDWTQPSLSEEQ